MSALTRAYPTAASQSIANATWAAITMGATRRDDLGMWVVGNPTRLTVPTGKGGAYALSGTLQWAVNATGTRGIALQVTPTGGGAAFFVAVDANAGGSGTYNTDLSIATVWSLTAGDYVELCGFQSSGAALNHTTAAGYGGELSAALLT